MNMNQFTQKTTAALQRAQSMAIEYQHLQVEQEHLMLALTEDSAELIPQLLQKCGIAPESVKKQLEEALTRIPRVSGPDVSRGWCIFPEIPKKPCWKRNSRRPG